MAPSPQTPPTLVAAVDVVGHAHALLLLCGAAAVVAAAQVEALQLLVVLCVVGVVVNLHDGVAFGLRGIGVSSFQHACMHACAHACIRAWAIGAHACLHRHACMGESCIQRLPM